ncbi:MAG TPA: FKBP-type peptidyl-prolyl cis-trans isomerase [Solirubrobacterales bacterium]|nr:FKBP-type peptidyl-prolyl cis-trans isomerase [Solirubrobacterales bacterium]
MFLRAALVSLVCLGLIAGGCGDGSSDGSSDDSTAVSSAGATTVDTESLQIPKKPDVPIPQDRDPDELIVRDLIPGTGAEIEDGDEAIVHYEMFNMKYPSRIDSSWIRKKPFTFTFGSAAVVEGWNRGMEGMKVGGRRALIVPPEFGYGAQGDSIVSPDTPLFIVIDLLAVE